MVRKFIVSRQNFPYFRGGRPVLNAVEGNPQENTHRNAKVLHSLVPGLPLQLSSLAVRITVRSVIRTASDDSCGGGLGTRLQIAAVEDWVQSYRSYTREAASADLRMRNW